MKYPISIIAILLLMVSIPASTQNFQGKIHYSSKSKVHILLDMEKFPESMKEKFKTGQEYASKKLHVLKFNKNSSFFTEDISVNINPSLGMRSNPKGPSMMIDYPGNYYKDIVTKSYINQKEIFGKQFIIHDKLETINWQKTNEVKTIGKYTCFKATAKLPKENSFNDKDNESFTTVIAWYTIDIPVSQGPGKYWGLPGLILEVQTEDVVYLCTKIELSKAEDIVIKIPKKGKKIAKNKFDKLFASTLKDIKDRHAN